MPLRRFLADETAAVTVDWVVLSAAIIGLALGTAAAVRTGVIDLGDDINAALSGAAVASLGSGPGSGGSQGLLAGVGTPGCDWYCLFAAFHEAENGPYDPDEWGPDVNHWANERVNEFMSYSTDFLHGTLAGYDYYTPQNTSEPYYSYYMGEARIIRNIIAERGG